MIDKMFDIASREKKQVDATIELNRFVKQLMEKYNLTMAELYGILVTYLFSLLNTIERVNEGKQVKGGG